MISDESKRLRKLYTQMWPQLCEIRSKGMGASWPLLIEPPSGFYQAKTRLMIVGQETHSWNCGQSGKPQSVGTLMQCYKKFMESHCQEHAPFWGLSYEIAQRLNGDKRHFVWSNLIKMDLHKDRPTQVIEDRICGTGLLQREMAILKPDVVVFFTGPNYDGRLRATFPGIGFSQVNERLDCRFIAKLSHANLPVTAYRTYHPKYLQLKRQDLRRALIQSIMQEVLS